MDDITTRGNVLSFSGGKDSTAMLLMMLERKEKIDAVVYFDTGWEFPQMYEHIDKLERNTGIKIVRLHDEHPMEWHMLERAMNRGNNAGRRGYGWARQTSRWCTKIKTSNIDLYIAQNRLSGSTQCVGIASDERWRCKPYKRYPLIEYGVTEADALAYCKEKGYDWGGLYDHFNRVSCWCCPLQGINELRELRTHYKDLWQKLRDMDSRSWNDFKQDRPIEYYEEMFDAEDKQMTLFDAI